MVHRVVHTATIRRMTRRCSMFVVGVVCSIWVVTQAQTAPPPASVLPGAQTDGSLLMPNGWKVSPAGRLLPVGTLPLNILTSPDGKYAVVTNDGISKPSITIVDLAKWAVKDTVALDGAWLGLVWHPDGTKLYSAGAGQNNVQEFTYADGSLTRTRSFQLPARTGDTFAG